MSSLALTAQLVDEDPDEAFRICNEHLREHPDDARALFIVGTINVRAERHSVALPVFERVVRLAPNRDEGWNNLGLCLVECGKPVEARDAFKRALSLSDKPGYMANLGCAYLNEGNYAEAKRWCRKALERDPSHAGANTTFGFAQLSTGDWQGWKGFEHALGGKFRAEVQFGDEPRWDGSQVDSLVIYGEQGLGDEIMYASCVPDALGKAKSVVIECDKRLEGLFRRSFPCEVYGTRRSVAPWAADRAFSARCAIGSLPSLFRPTPESCPKTPYLVADPERRIQWRALFDSWGRKPVIGLCWSGGRINTGRKHRQVGLEAFRSLIESVDAHFVSLQYTDATQEIEASGLPVRHIHRAVQSHDYDDTAAFVAECDLVIGPPTTAHHLAGALGVPSVILVPTLPMWAYASGDRLPWYEQQVFHRQKNGETWADCIKRLDIGEHLTQWSEA